MAIFAGFLLSVCLVIPNVAPTLNFMRFYRYSMILLAPLFILGGAYFLGRLKRIRRISSVESKFSLGDTRLLVLTIVLVVFFLFRSGFVNNITGDTPYSYSLDFDRMKASIFFTTGNSLYFVYVPEQDFFGARWLVLQIRNNSLIYVDYGMGITTLNYARAHAANRQNIEYIMNGTQSKPESYIYLRSFNVLGGLVAFYSGYSNLSDLYPSPSQNCRIYSNGASDIYFVP